MGWHAARPEIHPGSAKARRLGMILKYSRWMSPPRCKITVGSVLGLGRLGGLYKPRAAGSLLPTRTLIISLPPHRPPLSLLSPSLLSDTTQYDGAGQLQRATATATCCRPRKGRNYSSRAGAPKMQVHPSSVSLSSLCLASLAVTKSARFCYRSADPEVLRASSSSPVTSR